MNVQYPILRCCERCSTESFPPPRSSRCAVVSPLVGPGPPDSGHIHQTGVPMHQEVNEKSAVAGWRSGRPRDAPVCAWMAKCDWGDGGEDGQRCGGCANWGACCCCSGTRRSWMRDGWRWIGRGDCGWYPVRALLLLPLAVELDRAFLSRACQTSDWDGRLGRGHAAARAGPARPWPSSRSRCELLGEPLLAEVERVLRRGARAVRVDAEDPGGAPGPWPWAPAGASRAARGLPLAPRFGTARPRPAAAAPCPGRRSGTK